MIPPSFLFFLRFNPNYVPTRRTTVAITNPFNRPLSAVRAVGRIEFIANRAEQIELFRGPLQIDDLVPQAHTTFCGRTLSCPEFTEVIDFKDDSVWTATSFADSTKACLSEFPPMLTMPYGCRLHHLWMESVVCHSSFKFSGSITAIIFFPIRCSITGHFEIHSPPFCRAKCSLS